MSRVHLECIVTVCRLLIGFTRNKSEPEWKGYLYAMLMFGTVFLQSMVLHQYFHRCFLVGMRLRTSIIASVYKKVCGLTTAGNRWCKEM